MHHTGGNFNMLTNILVNEETVAE